MRYGYSAGADSILENYRASRGQGFGPEVKRRIMLGAYALSAGYYDAYYLKAQQVRTLIKQDFEQAFAQVDVIACPVAPTTAFQIGEKADDPLAMYLSDILTVTLNLAGMCGVSVPCGFDAAGLPIGLQLIGPHLGEPAVLRVADAYEQTTDWHNRWAPDTLRRFPARGVPLRTRSVRTLTWAAKHTGLRIQPMTEFPKTDQNRIRRMPERGHYDRETIHPIIDEALICHVGIVVDGRAGGDPHHPCAHGRRVGAPRRTRPAGC